MAHERADNHIFPFLWMRGESEEIVREEMARIDSCGIKAVCVEARPHDDYCGPTWWRDLDVVIDEAKKRDMRIWILDDKHFPTGYANGMIEQHPELKKLYINYNVVDIFGKSRQRTIPAKRMLVPTLDFSRLGEPFDEERLNNELLAIVACRVVNDAVIAEDSIDLTHTYDGEFATFELPEGAWRVYVIYRTRTDGGDPTYINMIDPASADLQIQGVYEPHYQHYKELFGNVIAGFFSDEPQFGNAMGFCKDGAIGKDGMALPWSNALEERLRATWGEDFGRMLPFLWAESDSMTLASLARLGYMDNVSALYAECFANHLGQWCEDHGVEYIGHVVEDDGCHARLGLGCAHWFRAIEGEHMAGIDCIGSQIVYGAPLAERRSGITPTHGAFFHYVLGKLGASAAHLEPKKRGRLMCELFGAYGWAFGVRDMRYVLDHLLSRGVNELVPHAFSMADYPDPDCPPHFYARGNNPQFPYFQELMRYANRMCDLLSGGTHVASVAVLYDAELGWCGAYEPMEQVARELACHQIDFDFVSLDMLCARRGHAPVFNADGTFQINGVSFSKLIVPHAACIPGDFANWIETHQVPVVFTDGAPAAVAGKDETPAFPSHCTSVSLDGLAQTLRAQGCCELVPDADFADLSFYHYRMTDHDLYLLLNESATDAFEGDVRIAEAGTYVELDVDTEKTWAIGQRIDGDQAVVSVHLDPAELLVLDRVEAEVAGLVENPRRAARLATPAAQLDISHGWTVSRASAKEYPKFRDAEQVEELRPYSESHPSFSGVIRYERSFELADAAPAAVISLEGVSELARVFIDGTEVGNAIQPPYRIPVLEGISAGSHVISVEVTTTADRDQLNYPAPPVAVYFEASEATGMYGTVTIDTIGA